MKTQKDSKKQYVIVLIISCVFAIIASALIIISICGFPQAIEGKQQENYLYENGVEVDAYIKGYYDDYGLVGSRGDTARIYKGRFHIVYEYIDDNNRTYTDEYLDTVECTTRDELSARELYIKQMIADEPTMKMLIANNGLCCLTVYKESLKQHTTLTVYSILIPVSSGVLGLCIFDIVRQSKKLRQLR